MPKYIQTTLEQLQRKLEDKQQIIKTATQGDQEDQNKLSEKIRKLEEIIKALKYLEDNSEAAASELENLTKVVGKFGIVVGGLDQNLGSQLYAPILLDIHSSSLSEEEKNQLVNLLNVLYHGEGAEDNVEPHAALAQAPNPNSNSTGNVGTEQFDHVHLADHDVTGDSQHNHHNTLKPLGCTGFLSS